VWLPRSDLPFPGFLALNFGNILPDRRKLDRAPSNS